MVFTYEDAAKYLVELNHSSIPLGSMMINNLLDAVNYKYHPEWKELEDSEIVAKIVKSDHLKASGFGDSSLVKIIRDSTGWSAYRANNALKIAEDSFNPTYTLVPNVQHTFPSKSFFGPEPQFIYQDVPTIWSINSNFGDDTQVTYKVGNMTKRFVFSSSYGLDIFSISSVYGVLGTPLYALGDNDVWVVHGTIVSVEKVENIQLSNGVPQIILKYMKNSSETPNDFESEKGLSAIPGLYPEQEKQVEDSGTFEGDHLFD